MANLGLMPLILRPPGACELDQGGDVRLGGLRHHGECSDEVRIQPAARLPFLLLKRHAIRTVAGNPVTGLGHSLAPGSGDRKEVIEVEVPSDCALPRRLRCGRLLLGAWRSPLL
jgi:hypothetical protein